MAASTSERDRRARRPALCVSTAVVRDGKVLVAARPSAPMAALYSLPGGKVEFGETMEEAARRELLEEVGIEADIIGFAGHVELIEPDGPGSFHAVVCAFAARWLAGEPAAGPEAADPRWVDPEELAKLATTRDLDRIVRRALDLVGSTRV